jgi:hypothetical protein
MTSFYGAPRRTPRVWAFLDDVKARLATATINALLGGAGRIYKATDDFDEPEGAEDAQWSRLVVIPVTTVWATPERAGHDRMLPFALRAETHPPDTSLDASKVLETIHEEALLLLEGWVPGVHTYYRVLTAVYRATTPQTQPEFDEARGLWLNTAQYTAHLLPPAEIAP